MLKSIKMSLTSVLFSSGSTKNLPQFRVDIRNFFKGRRNYKLINYKRYNKRSTHMDPSVQLSRSILSQSQDVQAHVVLCSPSQTKAKAPGTPL